MKAPAWTETLPTSEDPAQAASEILMALHKIQTDRMAHGPERFDVELELQGPVEVFSRATVHYRRGKPNKEGFLRPYETTFSSSGGALAGEEPPPGGIPDPMGLSLVLAESLVDAAEYAGTNDIDGRPCHVLFAPDMRAFARALFRYGGIDIGTDDVNDASGMVYVDAEYFVVRALNIEIDQRYEHGDGAAPLRINSFFDDYRPVGKGAARIPYPHAMTTITENVIPAAEQAKMAEIYDALSIMVANGGTPEQKEQFKAVAGGLAGLATGTISLTLRVTEARSVR